MVRHYVRKTSRTWTEEDLRKALQACKKMSVRAAAAKHGISRGTVRRYWRNETLLQRPSGIVSVFHGASEVQLIRYIDKFNDVVSDGISPRDLRRLAYDLAERLQLKHKFKGDSAGEDWAFSFHGQHPYIKIRSLKGPKVVDEKQVSKMFRRLSYLLDHHGIDVNDIYNMDEIGVVYFVGSSTGDNELKAPPPRLDPMLAGRLQLDVIFKTDDGQVIGQLATAVCCFSATGSFLPPTFVFPCGLLDVGDRLMSDAPPGSVVLFSDDGWTNREVFVDWLSFFVKHVRPSKDHKVLLLMDNDESHVSLSAYDYATQHGVVLLSVPTYSADTLLPVHRGLYESLSVRFDKSALNFDATLQSPSKEMALIRLFGRTFLECCSMRCAVDSFKSSGINPRDDSYIDQKSQANDGDSLEFDDCFEAIDSEDEVHLIDALYCNGKAEHRKVKCKSKAIKKPTKLASTSSVTTRAASTKATKALTTKATKATKTTTTTKATKTKTTKRLTAQAPAKTTKKLTHPSPTTATSTTTTTARKRARKSLPRKNRKSALQMANTEDSS